LHRQNWLFQEVEQIGRVPASPMLP
jgi:hypothetical protein